MMLKMAGKSGSADEITAVVTAAGGEADADAIAKLLADMEGKDVDALLASGMEALKDVKMGGGGGGSGGAGSADAGAEEEKEEEKAEEEEMDLSGGMDMFGGDAGDGDY